MRVGDYAQVRRPSVRPPLRLSESEWVSEWQRRLFAERTETDAGGVSFARRAAEAEGIERASGGRNNRDSVGQTHLISAAPSFSSKERTRREKEKREEGTAAATAIIVHYTLWTLKAAGAVASLLCCRYFSVRQHSTRTTTRRKGRAGGGGQTKGRCGGGGGEIFNFPG